MDEQFRREYMCEYVIDHEFEAYVKSWEIYHKTADQLDGHIKVPRDIYDVKLMREASEAGQMAQRRYLMEKSIASASIDKKKWQRAKQEALRRLGK